jgi:hypothetical protein
MFEKLCYHDDSQNIISWSMFDKINSKSFIMIAKTLYTLWLQSEKYALDDDSLNIIPVMVTVKNYILHYYSQNIMFCIMSCKMTV